MFERIRKALGFGKKSLMALLPTWQVSLGETTALGAYYTPLIYGIVNKIAGTAAGVQLVVRNRDGEIVMDHPLKRLIQKPNPYMSEYDFWYSVIAGMLIQGSVYYEKQRNAGGQVIGLWPLPLGGVSPIVQGVEVVAYQTYKADGTRVLIDANDVVRFSVYDPRGIFSEFSPCQIALSLVEVDVTLSEIVKTFLKEGAAPLGVITTKVRVTEDEVERIQARWRERYGGVRGMVVPAVLDVDAEYQKIGSSLNELIVPELDARTESRICLVFDIPPVIAGVKIGLDRSTFSNYAEARRAWWEESIIPRYEAMLDVIQNSLASEFTKPNDGYRIEWDYSRSPVQKEHEQELTKTLLEAFKAGAITINELRARLGYEGLDEGDHVIPQGNTPQETKSVVIDGTRVRWERGDKPESPLWLESAIEELMADYFEEQKKIYLEEARRMYPERE